jgi:hypothetical protein
MCESMADSVRCHVQRSKNVAKALAAYHAAGLYGDRPAQLRALSALALARLTPPDEDPIGRTCSATVVDFRPRSREVK